jgi:hypothetical protein
MESLCRKETVNEGKSPQVEFNYRNTERNIRKKLKE